MNEALSRAGAIRGSGPSLSVSPGCASPANAAAKADANRYQFSPHMLNISARFLVKSVTNGASVGAAETFARKALLLAYRNTAGEGHRTFSPLPQWQA